MQKARTTSRIVTALLAGTVIGLPGAAAGVALAHPAYAPKQASCAILGTYHLGARVLPLATSARGHAGVPTPAPGHARVAAAIAQPAWLLGGSLVISAYTGCGGATMGSFTVHRTAVGPGIYGPRRGARAIPCAVSCWLPPTGVISATGRFVQDSMHPTDPTYVLVSATLTSARLRPQRGIPCSNVTGCPPSMVLTTTLTFTDVTGYLQVPPPTGQMATLSFLPPPGASTDVAPMAMVLQGWRGNVVPQPAPTPARRPATGHRPPATGHRPPVAGRRSPVAGTHARSVSV